MLFFRKLWATRHHTQMGSIMHQGNARNQIWSKMDKILEHVA